MPERHTAHHTGCQPENNTNRETINCRLQHIGVNHSQFNMQKIKAKEKTTIITYNKSSSGDEIPERDVTYLLSVYLFTTELRHTCTSGIFSENRVPVTYLMDIGLRKAPCVSKIHKALFVNLCPTVSCYYPLSVFLAYTSLLSVSSDSCKKLS